MSFDIRKQLHKDANVKWKRRVKPYKDWDRLGLELKEKPTVPIEEMRRLALVLAGNQLQHGARSRFPVGKDIISDPQKAGAKAGSALREPICS